jgi:3-methylfumaryl-CoA hydratase
VSEVQASTRLAQVQAGDSLPWRELVCDNVQSMLYNAALWNGHRIHFDEPYAKQVEGYPGLVVPGPLLGDWLHQCLEEWLGEDGYIASIEYSNRIAVYTGDKVRSGGTVTGCYPDRAEAEVEVFILNEAGETVAPGKALVRFTGNW